MELILKTAYYSGCGIVTLVFAFFFFANLLDPSTPGRHKLIFLGSGAVCIGFLIGAFRMGHMGGQWFVGLALAVLGLVVAAVLVFAGLFAFTNIHWQ